MKAIKLWFYKTLFLSLILLSSGSIAGIEYQDKTDRKQQEALSADGPYLFDLPEGKTRFIAVNSQGQRIDTVYAKRPQKWSFEVTDHQGNYPFKVTLHPIKRPTWQSKKPQKIVVLSDPHGRLDCMVSVLQGNGVINHRLKWSFGKNHLVIIGDIFDRGKDVTAILWLCYQLEQEAESAGGRVSFLLGNHEALVLSGDLRYCKEKYLLLAEKSQIPYPTFFGQNTELGRWLATRNTIEVMGDLLFVHAGLGEKFYQLRPEISTVNLTISNALNKSKKERNACSELTAFLYGSEGPLWYRGLVRTDDKYHPAESETLKGILMHYGVNQLFVGHTIFKEVSSFYDGKVIGVNVDNEENKEEKRSRGVLIEKGRLYVIGDHGKLDQGVLVNGVALQN